MRHGTVWRGKVIFNRTPWCGQAMLGQAGFGGARHGEVVLQLRTYQEWFRHDILNAMRNGANSVLAVLPTGGGKRYSIVDLCLLAMNNNRRALVVTNRRLLVEQMVNECESHGVHYGVLMAGFPRGDSSAPVQVASIQSLQSWYLKKGMGARYGVDLPDWDLLLVDEAHNDLARYAELRAIRPQAKCVGFSATPVGPEGRCLTPHTFDKMIEGTKNSELIEMGYLLPCRVFAPSEPSLKGVHRTDGREYNQVQLGRAVKGCTTVGDVFKEYEKFQDRSAVIFAPGADYARYLEQQFNDRYGPCAKLIEAKTPQSQRDDIFAAVTDGTLQVLVSIDILREGADLPILSLGIDLTPNSQLRTWWQKIGRVKRPYGDQKDAVLVDLAGNFWMHLLHPNDDPEWPDGEETTTSLKEKKQADPKAPEPICCPKCGHVRMRGPACPECGHEGSKSVRRIREGEGVLREVQAHELKKRIVSSEEKMFAKWKQRLFGALRSGLSYSQCAAIFHREHGQMPKHGWPGTFPAHDIQWRRKPVNDYNFKTWAETCRHYERKLRDEP